MSSTPLQVIAMDGPAASGKSSVARLVAQSLDWVYVNTGNMYRAATLAALRASADLKSPESVLAALQAAEFDTSVQDGRSLVTLAGEDVEALLNGEDINKAVSHVAAVPAVREMLVNMQRAMALENPVVMEGRDIGTVVFPDAPWKFYIDASEEVRASRRGLQGQADAVAERDRLDSTRKVAPLKAANDALVIDSTEMTLPQVVDRVLDVLRSHGLEIRI